jgi:hypothetical protein
VTDVEILILAELAPGGMVIAVVGAEGARFFFLGAATAVPDMA